ncbi:MAG: hypothetical protein ACOZQL_03035 [Myxococcota bacterium]
MRPALLIVCAASVAWADKPAAVQLCLQLPADVALFTSAPDAHHRALGNGVFMLDLDVLLDGAAPERITKSSADCLRAWLPARRLERVRFDFARLPLNQQPAERTVALQLKPDLWFDGGSLAIERAPWSSLASSLDGEVKLERTSARGPEPVEDWRHLPRGSYVVTHQPLEPARGTCAVTLSVVGIGTVRADRNGALFRELAELYRQELLPAAMKQQKLKCTAYEAVQARVELVDGVFRRPLDPDFVRVRLPEKEPRLVLRVDGVEAPFTSGMRVEVGVGQQLELAVIAAHAER